MHNLFTLIRGNPFPQSARTQKGRRRRALSFAGLTGGAALLSACVSLGSAEAPPFLLDLQADNQIASGAEQSGQAGQAITLRLPTLPKKIDTLRVPVQSGTTIAYLKNAIWVERPGRLFQGLLAETISAKSDRLVLKNAQGGGKSTDILSGTLVNFGLDGPSLTAIVTFDAVRINGGTVQKKRFEAKERVSEAAPRPVAEGLNKAANDVAVQVASWIG